MFGLQRYEVSAVWQNKNQLFSLFLFIFLSNGYVFHREKKQQSPDKNSCQRISLGGIIVGFIY